MFYTTGVVRVKPHMLLKIQYQIIIFSIFKDKYSKEAYV